MNPYIYAGLPMKVKILASDKNMMFFKDVCNSDIDDMLRSACEITKADYDKTINRSRKRECIDAKGIVCYFLRRYSRMTLTKIGEALKLDHATIMHHVKKFNDLVDVNDAIIMQYVTKFKSSNIDLITKYKMV